MGNMCTNCCGDEDPNESTQISSRPQQRVLQHQPQSAVSEEERRQAMLNAAEKRRNEEQSRGHKTLNPEFERLKHRQERIDRAEEEVAKAGGAGNTSLAWQVS